MVAIASGPGVDERLRIRGRRGALLAPPVARTQTKELSQHTNHSRPAPSFAHVADCDVAVPKGL